LQGAGTPGIVRDIALSQLAVKGLITILASVFDGRPTASTASVILECLHTINAQKILKKRHVGDKILMCR
jgi:hypothetical protein